MEGKSILSQALNRVVRRAEFSTLPTEQKKVARLREEDGKWILTWYDVDRFQRLICKSKEEAVEEAIRRGFGNVIDIHNGEVPMVHKPVEAAEIGNPFSLEESVEYKKVAKEATEEIKKAVDNLLEKVKIYKRAGTTDPVAREKIIEYIARKIYPHG